MNYITVVDYGIGNLGSIFNMFKRLNINAKIIENPKEIKKSDKLLLPGVGSFDSAMYLLNESPDLMSELNEAVMIKKIPILGICLGMQLLTRGSEEGILPGLGWIDAKTVKFKLNNTYKIPHMGWNTIDIVKNSLLIKGMQEEEQRFYFVHSYHVVCNDPADILAETIYGYRFTSMIQRDNIFGAQFHPEKSHKFGMQLLKNFANL